jgi:hypothetical protein
MESQARVKRLLVVRTVLAVLGVVVWGYGYRVDDPDIRLGAIIVLALALLLRFVPKRWLGIQGEQSGPSPDDR